MVKGIDRRDRDIPGAKGGNPAAAGRLAAVRAKAVLGCKAGAALFGGFSVQTPPPVRFSWLFGEPAVSVLKLSSLDFRRGMIGVEKSVEKIPPAYL